MLSYAILGHDAPNSLQQRLAVRPAHLARIESLQQQGRLLIAGPLPAIDSADPGTAGFVGSLLIARFASLDEARAWAEDDPYRHAGAWQSIDVWPFKQVAP
jgi:uncharacterized protein